MIGAAGLAVLVVLVASYSGGALVAAFCAGVWARMRSRGNTAITKQLVGGTVIIAALCSILAIANAVALGARW
ncbi:MAG: hypothetical protein HWE26_13775 [Alteromonadaceae bacterium]|nr:hypothetical protein [Alteromonadaceae bacterium]